jgi:hypothetical protein
MRRPAHFLAATALAAASVIGVSAPASAATTTGPCTLPDVKSSAPVYSSSGQQVGIAELRRETVHRLLGSYYRYCARFALTSAPAQPLVGTVTLKHTLRTGSQPILYSTTGPLTYPSYGLSSPTIDVHRGTIAYAVSFHLASAG